MPCDFDCHLCFSLISLSLSAVPCQFVEICGHRSRSTRLARLFCPTRFTSSLRTTSIATDRFNISNVVIGTPDCSIYIPEMCQAPSNSFYDELEGRRWTLPFIDQRLAGRRRRDLQHEDRGALSLLPLAVSQPKKLLRATHWVTIVIAR